MENVIILFVLTAIIAGIVLYLRRAKKRGEKCIGCPYCKQCTGGCNGQREYSKTDDEK